jgi:hypothetical protein
VNLQNPTTLQSPPPQRTALVRRAATALAVVRAPRTPSPAASPVAPPIAGDVQQQRQQQERELTAEWLKRQSRW